LNANGGPVYRAAAAALIGWKDEAWAQASSMYQSSQK
jgi:hypothetical protein